MYKNIIKIILFSLLILDINKAHAVKLEDISIIVPSCDKYSGLWEPFFNLLFKNWPALNQNGEDQDIPIYFISNNKEFNHPRVQNIKFPNEISWSDNMLEALSQVKTKYILYLQEDYFLTKPVNVSLLAEMLQYLKQKNAAFLQIAYFASQVQTVKQLLSADNNGRIQEFTKHSPFRVSLQAGLWERDSFMWLLKSGENIWRFEVDGSKRSEGMQKLFLANTSDSDMPIHYLNAVAYGMLLKGAVDYLHNQNIAFDPKLQALPLDQDIKSKLIMFKRRTTHRIVDFIKKHQDTIKKIIL